MTHLTPEDLGKKIQQARASENKIPKRHFVETNSAAGQVVRVVVELTAAIFVGAVFGYWIDRWLDTTPWAMIGLLFVGFIAGILNIYRMQMRVSNKDRQGKSQDV